MKIQKLTSKFQHASKPHIATMELLIDWVARHHDETPTALIIVSCESYTYSQLDDQPQVCRGLHESLSLPYFLLCHDNFSSGYSIVILIVIIIASKYTA